MGGIRYEKDYRRDSEIFERHTHVATNYGLQDGHFGECNRVEEHSECSSTWKRIWGRFQALVFTLALCLGSFPSFALGSDPVLSYNDMAVVWGPTSVGTGYGTGTYAQGVVVTANANLNAALVTLGYDVLDQRLTHDVKAKLSNESTGGAFYSFAQMFTRFNSGSGDSYHYPPWLASATGTVDTLASLYGASNVWWCMYQQSDFDNAKRDLDTILDGGNIGGGGDSGDLENGMVLYSDNVTPSRNSGYVAVYTYDGTNLGTRIKYISAYVDDSNYDYVQNITLDANETFFQEIGRRTQNFNNPVTLLRLYPENGGVQLDICIGSNLQYNTQTHEVTADSNIYTLSRYSGTRYVGYKDNVYYLLLNTSSLQFTETSSRLTLGGGVATWVNMANGGSGGGSDTPETNWPEDEPTPTPTPPVVPGPTVQTLDPKDPNPDPPSPVDPTPDPQPDPPTPTNPVDPTPDPPTQQPTYNTSTFTVDLQGILDALDEHCQHLQNAIYNAYTSLYVSLSSYLGDEFSTTRANDISLATDTQSVIVDQVGYLNDNIVAWLATINTNISDQSAWLGGVFENEIDYLNDNMLACSEHLEDYLNELFEWLADQLQFDYEPFNDNSILYWLKRIYAALGNGINSKPTDPVADPIGTGNWLDKLLDTILDNLGDILPTIINTVGDFFDVLKSKFPFSIPWDVLAILTLLVAEPITPEWTIPQYTWDGTQLVEVGEYVITLEDFDLAMGGVRYMLKISFILYMLVNTKKWMEMIDAAIGAVGGGKAAGD